MARNVYYDAPDLLASAATYASGRKQRRANIKDTIANQLTVDQANAKLSQSAQDTAARTNAADADRIQREARTAFDQQRAKEANEALLLANREDNARMAQVAEMQNARQLETAAQTQQNNVQNRQHAFVQAGLKSGSLYYTPHQTQELANINNSITKVQTQDDIDPDVRNQMLDTLFSNRERITLSPAMRPAPPESTGEQMNGKNAPWSPSQQRFYGGDD